MKWYILLKNCLLTHWTISKNLCNMFLRFFMFNIRFIYQRNGLFSYYLLFANFTFEFNLLIRFISDLLPLNFIFCNFLWCFFFKFFPKHLFHMRYLFRSIGFMWSCFSRKINRNLSRRRQSCLIFILSHFGVLHTHIEERISNVVFFIYGFDILSNEVIGNRLYLHGRIVNKSLIQHWGLCNVKQ